MVRVRVLLEHTLACTPAELLGTASVSQELAVRSDCFIRVGGDEDLLARLEPAQEPEV